MLENIMVQIAVGLIPVMLFFVALGIFSKKHKVANVVISIFFLSMIGVLVIPELLTHQKKQETYEYDNLSLVYAVADEGSFDLAKTLLEDLRSDYKPEYALVAARLAAISGDFEVAKALYQKSLSRYPEVETEYSGIGALCEADDKFYGISDKQEVQSSYAERSELLLRANKDISAAIEESVIDTEDNIYDKIAEYIVYAEEAHKEYLTNLNVDQSEIEGKVKRVNHFLEENPGIDKIPQVRLARLKLQLLNGIIKK